MIPDEPTTIGEPTLIPRQDVLCTILDLIVCAWPRVIARSDIDCDSDEPDIAGALYDEWWNEKENRGIQGPPRLVNEPAERSSRKKLKPSGFIDFRFTYDWGYDDYFGAECKRVSGVDVSLARKYAIEGVVRFADGKYCPGHACAGMLGFVIDGDIPGSVKLVRRYLKKHKRRCRMTGTLDPDGQYPVIRRLYRSVHKRARSRKLLSLLHVFLSFD